MYQNPKGTKQEIKLWAFYLLDIGIVVGMLVIANYITKIFPLSGGMEILFYIISICFGIFLCARTPSHPTERNLMVMINIFKMDNNNYHSIDIKNFDMRKEDR